MDNKPNGARMLAQIEAIDMYMDRFAERINQDNSTIIQMAKESSSIGHALAKRMNETAETLKTKMERQELSEADENDFANATHASMQAMNEMEVQMIDSICKRRKPQDVRFMEWAKEARLFNKLRNKCIHSDVDAIKNDPELAPYVAFTHDHKIMIRMSAISGLKCHIQRLVELLPIRSGS